MIINHNIAALNTYNRLSANNSVGSKALEKLSSGLRINRAGDDAAGLAISEKMRGQIRGLDQATRNSQDAISLIQTAEGALSETHSILQRMRELAVQSASDTNTASDRAEIQKEVDQLATEITRISTDTEFNTKKLLNGDMGKVATQTSVNGAPVFTDLQVTGSDISNGSYNLEFTSVGTDTFTVSAGATAVTTATIADDLTVAAGAHIKYGSYALTVSGHSAAGTDVGQTATFTLVGPDGTTTVRSGQSTDAAFDIGGVHIDAATEGILQNGVVSFTLTATGVDLVLTGDKSVDPSAATYSGGTIDLGGFEFQLLTGHGSDGDDATFTVIDKAVKFHIGANKDQSASLSVNNMSATALGVNTLNVSTQVGANAALTTLDAAITTVSAERSKLGAMQNRLEHTINNLTTSSENLSASESRIRDVDMAKEMMNYTKTNILTQAATAMLAQANQQPQNVLQLLK